jgi:superoxide dismutase, Cu-Zn family
MSPTTGYAASGKVEFLQAGNGTHVTVDLVGLSPNTEHGIHVHERGDCSSSDGMSAGGHFNPEGVTHGAYDHPPHHAGDMPNVKADVRGEVHTSFDTGALSIGSGAGDIVGKAVVVHREADDYKSQPAGNSGPRVSCGVIVRK